MNMDEKTIAVVITAGAVLCTALYNYYFKDSEVKELPEITVALYVEILLKFGQFPVEVSEV